MKTNDKEGQDPSRQMRDPPPPGVGVLLRETLDPPVAHQDQDTYSDLPVVVVLHGPCVSPESS